MVSNDSTGTFVAGFVVGGIIGTAIAQIFAPESPVFASGVQRMPWRELNVRTKRQAVDNHRTNASSPLKGPEQ